MTAAVLELEHAHGRAGLAGAVASEWTKLWTVRSTWLNLASSVVLTALLGVQFGFSGAYENTHLDPGQLAEQVPVGAVAVNVTTIVQVVVAALAMLTITSEYSTGSIRSTLQWTPVRRHVLLAKAIVLTPVLFLSGLLFGAIAAGSGGLALGEWAEVDAGALTGDLLSVAGYLTLAGLFTLGIGVLIQSAAGTLTAAFLLLMVAPMMLAQSGFRDPHLDCGTPAGRCGPELPDRRQQPDRPSPEPRRAGRLGSRRPLPGHQTPPTPRRLTSTRNPYT